MSEFMSILSDAVADLGVVSGFFLMYSLFPYCIFKLCEVIFNEKLDYANLLELALVLTIILATCVSTFLAL